MSHHLDSDAIPKQDPHQHLVDCKAIVMASSAELLVSKMDRARSKGNLLYKMMLADSTTAGQLMNPPTSSAESGWKLAEDLSAAGYVEDADLHEPGYYHRYIDDVEEVGTLLDSIGFNPSFARTDENTFITHRHTIKEGEDSQAYYQSYFEQIINPVEGLIVAHDNRSPLTHSDVAFLQWSLRTELKFELRYVLRYFVCNRATRDVIEGINPKHLHLDLPWPGVTYLATSEEGHALIGTPNGSGVAYLLIQHKSKLGHKIIESITVFTSEGYRLMLLFHIVGVDDTQCDEDDYGLRLLFRIVDADIDIDDA
ncbi:hypothetical protein DE146DRAFT_755098 [Phaeosphaeria sp. MPI-PUGE-AT-0046c]|nr:hypothetical protein DE146DRAFT_755098 [Phaeosphaeria sp. MPI-PUGE-AT-0046c]